MALAPIDLGVVPFGAETADALALVAIAADAGVGLVADGQQCVELSHVRGAAAPPVVAPPFAAPPSVPPVVVESVVPPVVPPERANAPRPSKPTRGERDVRIKSHLPALAVTVSLMLLRCIGGATTAERPLCTQYMEAW